MFNKQYFKKHLVNSRGVSIPDKIVVIESDDWGSIRIPNKEAQAGLLQEGLISLEDPFSAYDCLESNSDFQALFDVLHLFKDKQGNFAQLTANMVMTNPDFYKIEVNGFQEYYGESFTETYRAYYPETYTLEKLKEGIDKGYLFPQFHAREHLNVNRWLSLLNSKDDRFLKAFALKCFAIDDENESNKRGNLMATYDYQSDKELADIKSGIVEGLDLFESTFGFASNTTIAPCYVWNRKIEEIFWENNINAFQSSYAQQYNDVATMEHKRIWKKTGVRNALGQRYFVRNVLFEPALDLSIDWVSKALESIAVAFFWKKPAVIGSHRINYVAGLSLSNRENTLIQLNELLEKVLAKWPDVKFMNSSQLNQYYKGG